MADSADPNTPSWLQEDTGDANPGASVDPTPVAVAVAVDDPKPSTKASAVTTSSASGENFAEEVDEDLPGVILLMRLANMAAAVALIVCAVLEIIDNPAKIGSVVLAVYACCGGLLICCLETQLKFLRIMIAVNFGFLFNAGFRFLFNGLMGSVAWTFDGIFGKAVAIALGAVGLFNTYVLCKYPSYRKMREKIAQEEDKRIEGKIREQVKKQAAAQLVS
uniref:Uncharacterized protein n=1 Tax=Entomoneis paludosa TaxID=265537 RepID=A0A7S2YGJ3_9STRA